MQNHNSDKAWNIPHLLTQKSLFRPGSQRKGSPITTVIMGCSELKHNALINSCAEMMDGVVGPHIFFHSCV